MTNDDGYGDEDDEDDDYEDAGGGCDDGNGIVHRDDSCVIEPGLTTLSWPCESAFWHWGWHWGAHRTGAKLIVSCKTVGLLRCRSDHCGHGRGRCAGLGFHGVLCVCSCCVREWHCMTLELCSLLALFAHRTYSQTTWGAWIQLCWNSLPLTLPIQWLEAPHDSYVVSVVSVAFAGSLEGRMHFGDGS